MRRLCAHGIGWVVLAIVGTALINDARSKELPISVEGSTPTQVTASPPPPENEARDAGGQAPGVVSALTEAGTTQFGHYEIRADGLPYAVAGETWTFDHGSSDALEGWSNSDLSLSGEDEQYWERITADDWSAHGDIGPAPIISGSASAWLGVHEDDADDACWATGTGYGNLWAQSLVSPMLAHTSGNVTLAFDYFVECEAGFDFARVVLLQEGFETIELASFDGALGTPSSPLHASLTIADGDFDGTGEFQIAFRFTSDVSYSDEDGDFDSVSGPFAVDNISVSGAIVGASRLWDFEANFNGFEARAFDPDGVSDYLGVESGSTYGCAELVGNVMELHDASGTHPSNQWEAAESPIVDLNGVEWEALRAEVDLYADLVQGAGLYFRLGWKYYPSVCPATGELVWSDRVGPGTFQFTGGPLCNRLTLSGVGVVPLAAEKVRLVIEVADLCGPVTCTEPNNGTPVFDNIQVVAYSNLGSISGTVYEDFDGDCQLADSEAALSGRQVRLTKVGEPAQNRVTDASGAYTFTALPEGTYTVSLLALSGWVNCSPLVIDLGEDEDRIEQLGSRRPASISGTVFADPNQDCVRDSGDLGRPGRTVRLEPGGATLTTDANGSYRFAPLDAGQTYTVSLDPLPGGHTCPSVEVPIQAAAEQVLDVDFGTYLYQGTISGVVYRDLDGDCVRDGGEPPLAGQVVRMLLNGGAWQDVTGTDGFGSYSFGTLPPGNYTLQLVTGMPPWATAQTCQVQVTLGADDQEIADLALIPLDLDLAVQLGSDSAPRPGRAFQYVLQWMNAGQAESDATIVLELPPALIVEDYGSGTLDGPNHRVTWTETLPSGAWQFASVRVRVPVGTPLGTPISATATITPDSGQDLYLPNNTSTELRITVGSFDPNDKAVSPEGAIPPERELSYKIRFQNVGTAEAIDIMVQDTLEADLDTSTLRLGPTSHPCQIFASGRELIWYFPGINLPDSTTNEPGSHGFVSFSIQPKADLPLGAEVSNDAAIYFDFNEPVLTNVVTNTIRLTGSVGGSVVADCPAPDTGLEGVQVTAYLNGGAIAGGSALTDADGAYSIQGLVIGSYDVRITIPSGYQGDASELEVLIAANEETNADFALTCPRGSVGGHVYADCPTANTPLGDVGIDVYADGTNTLIASGATDATGSYSIPEIDPGSYDVAVLVPPGYSATNPVRDVVVTADQASTADFALQCIPQGPGSIAGRVTASCPQPGTGLHGVTVDVFSVGTGTLIATTVTDVTGNYAVPELDPGDYIVAVIRPLGYVAVEDEQEVTVTPAQPSMVNFSLSCADIDSDPETASYWKHQVAVAIRGHGQAEVNAATLCSYLDRIAEHFNSNEINPVEVYQPPASGDCMDKLEEAKAILNLRGSDNWRARSRKQLLSLLLNVAAGRVSQMAVVSADGATLSQAITYCDNVIDDPSGNHQLVRNIAKAINNGEPVPVGWIPLDTQDIGYRMPPGIDEEVPFRSWPNPGHAARDFHFSLGTSAPVTLEIFDAAGRLVAKPLERTLSAGRHRIPWNGRGDSGYPLESGIYFARLSNPEAGFRETIKVVVVNRSFTE